MTHATVASAKAALRLAVRNRRRALVAEHPEADWRAAEAAKAELTARFPSTAGKTAALYRALGSELDPRALATWLVSVGWSLALPRVEDDAQMSFRRWTLGEPLAHDAAGLPAPSDEARWVDPDLVVVPLLAFDAAGQRLGQGAGWYDRALADLRERKQVLIVGLAYSGQEVASVPTEAHDQPLDAVITEIGWRPVAPALEKEN